jgi:hypothetical protein
MEGLFNVLRGTATEERGLIAAGPLSRQPQSTPYRVVLARDGQGFTVHCESFQASDLASAVGVSFRSTRTVYKSWLSNGYYFKAGELVEATKKFAERVAQQAEFLTSLERVG